MSDIGVEVGQKMRSAIKAKLTELDCYVDDELPDYIMVMIANKRTRSQMKEDLLLFLATKTATFVEWLHIVLKKLKEVHVTNPEVFKKPAKRKPNELVISEDDFKKIKKEKKEEHKALKKARKEAKASKELQKSLTDDLPITANKLSEARKIVVMNENNLRQQAQNQANSGGSVDEDGFDIPLLSEISSSNEEELELLEKKIKNVKSRLGLHVESDEEDDCLNIKADPEDLSINEQLKKNKEPAMIQQQPQPKPERKIIVEQQQQLNLHENNNTAAEDPPPKKSAHTRITFDKERDSLKAKYDAILKRNITEESTSQKKKRSVLERLGKRTESERKNNSSIEKKVVEKKTEKVLHGRVGKGEKIREGILSRLGVMSKVSIPTKRAKTPEIEVNEEEELKLAAKEVPSVVKLKPRILPPKTKQANPNLLFKAVAEAQRSVTQTPSVGGSESPALFTKKYKEKLEMERHNDKEKEKEKEKEIPRKAKLLEEDKLKLKVLLTEKIEVEEEPKPETPTINHKFIVTLDGIEKTKFSSANKDEAKRSIIKTRRTPSPIVFESQKPERIPDKLPTASAATALKNKERCKYWPGCRQGEKCEFFHPTTTCKMFPNCKFEDKCLYVHPVCKFETSCTRRDCPYSHTGKNVPRVLQTAAAPSQKPSSQICKFFPNCSNGHCTFYHPRLCKFGVFCKNQSECNFVHSFPTAKAGNLTWRSDHK